MAPAPRPGLGMPGLGAGGGGGGAGPAAVPLANFGVVFPAAAALPSEAGSRSPGNRLEAPLRGAPSPRACPQASSAPLQAWPPPAGA